MKTCNKCYTSKPLSEYHNDKKAKDGKSYRCKECAKMSTSKWQKENKEKVNLKNKIWREKNPEKMQSFRDSWDKRNSNYKKIIKCAAEMKRKASKLKATPVWADKDLIKDMYIEAKYQDMQVDHIVPLKSDKVCGLHWEGNLQLLTAEENQSKGNRYWEGM